MAKFRVEVDRTVCQGFGACVELCPGSFYLSDLDGKTKIRGAKEIFEDDRNVKDILEVEDLGCFRLTEEACPFKAIEVVEF